MVSLSTGIWVFLSLSTVLDYMSILRLLHFLQSAGVESTSDRLDIHTRLSSFLDPC